METWNRLKRILSISFTWHRRCFLHDFRASNFSILLGVVSILCVCVSKQTSITSIQQLAVVPQVPPDKKKLTCGPTSRLSPTWIKNKFAGLPCFGPVSMSISLYFCRHMQLNMQIYTTSQFAALRHQKSPAPSAIDRCRARSAGLCWSWTGLALQ